MSEFRQNKATGEWVIIATERAERPDQFAEKKREHRTLPEHSAECPFCPGNESHTPQPSLVIGKSNRWDVRVVPNKFAALQPGLIITRERVGRYLKADGYGVAEVIIETPRHDLCIATMPESHVRLVLEAYRQRTQEVARTRDINFITLFQNHGERAGTSLEHPHSQLIATPIIPPHIRDQIHQSMLHYDTLGQCVYCEIMEEELEQQARIILATDHFIAFTPFASRSPFEVRIFPRAHRSFFGDTTDEELDDLSRVLKTVLFKIHRGLDNPDYNYIFRSAPVGDHNAKYFHWYVMIVPRLTTPAGFEMGSGIFINVTSPEECAEFLRNVEMEATV